ncbi:MAG: hypothetical protein U0L49_03045, partial [Eubacterium sp.]|nr:hypothetical protein [Eubacterium sp.]
IFFMLSKIFSKEFAFSFCSFLLSFGAFFYFTDAIPEPVFQFFHPLPGPYSIPICFSFLNGSVHLQRDLFYRTCFFYQYLYLFFFSVSQAGKRKDTAASRQQLLPYRCKRPGTAPHGPRHNAGAVHLCTHKESCRKAT